MNHNRLVLGLAGNPGTGKSTVALHLIAKHGFIAHEGSDILRAEAKTEGITLRERLDYIAYFREQQVKRRNMAWLSDSVIQDTSPRIMQVGLRSKYDARNLRAHGGIILGLICPEEQCFERIDRSNPKNPQTLDEYIEHTVADNSSDEYGAHTELVVAEADFVIDTSQEQAAVNNTLDTIIARHLGGYAIL